MVSSSSWVWRSMTCSFSTLSSSTAVRELIHCKSIKFHISAMHPPLEPRKQVLAKSLSTPTGNSGTASSLVTTRGHFITAHMHNFKGRDNEGPSTEKLYGILTENCCRHMAIHQSSCPLGTQFMLQHTFYPEVSKPRQLHHCSQVVTTQCWFSRVPSIRTFSVSYHQTNTAKSTELRATEIHLQENYCKKKN